MQAVILAAGKGTRMGEATLTTPKPMLTVGGLPLLAHKIDAMPREIDKVVLIIGYLGHKIKEFFGERYGGRTITYVEVTELNGTGGCLWQARDVLGERFLVMMGDDIYSGDDMAEMIRHDWAVLGKRAHESEHGGMWIVENDRILGIEEGATYHEGNVPRFMNPGMYMLTKDIFNYPLVKVPGKDNEWGLPQTILTAVNDRDIALVKTDFWIQVTSQDDLRVAEMILGGPSAELIDSD